MTPGQIHQKGVFGFLRAYLDRLIHMLTKFVPLSISANTNVSVMSQQQTVAIAYILILAWHGMACNNFHTE